VLLAPGEPVPVRRSASPANAGRETGHIFRLLGQGALKAAVEAASGRPTSTPLSRDRARARP
jgi:hypothetical protein